MAKDKPSKKSKKEALREEPSASREPEGEESALHPGDVKLVNRLKRVEGQVRGIRTMVEEERPAEEILVQLSAIKSAINKAGLTLLERHTEAAVKEAAVKGTSEKTVKQLNSILAQWLK
ncbi:metal-sensitive transcriptional regulator [Paenibacillus gansuensis]|uniref:Metal-sensitive transcriptional regulator n=1 Tax=Paenibacillus gansuensis TaxID=306542 RepID=A0ABW5PD53_9BACL